LAIAREGWSLQDILAHGVINYHSVTVGPGPAAADHMQTWFEAEAVDGFWVLPDVNADGINAFVEEVVPLLQARGLFHHEYEGQTLRENLGVPYQYGVDPRITQPATCENRNHWHWLHRWPPGQAQGRRPPGKTQFHFILWQQK
jgi:hypothetical protein